MCLCDIKNPLLYIENPNDPTKKLLELIRDLNKVGEYKINIEKSVAFLMLQQ